MDFTNIKDMSIGNLKITSIYYNGNILYQEQSKRELTLIKMGEVTFNNIYIAPQVSNIDGGSIKLLEMGQTTFNS